MRNPEDELIEILKGAGIDFTSSLPCEKIKLLLEMISSSFYHIPLTREEEGVGISTGAALSGRRPAIFVQSSGIGNMINSLLSLTGFYELPLSIFVSQRGIHKEKIAAQFPMGQRLPGILKGAGIPYSVISSRKDFSIIKKKLNDVYSKNKIHAFLLNPVIWEKSKSGSQPSALSPQQNKTEANKPAIKYRNLSFPPVGNLSFSLMKKDTGQAGMTKPDDTLLNRISSPKLTRFEILEIIAPYLNTKIVVCNLGFPSKELFDIKHQPSNFYMLGSMGMATPIGLGISITSVKDVVVIDGDGSLLMNPGTLATAAYLSPRNLTILAIDNGSYGSTGDQPTLTGSCVDLEKVAKGFGMRNTFKVSARKQLINIMKNRSKGLRFIHALAIPGNKDVPNIPLHHLKIKKQVQDFLKTE